MTAIQRTIHASLETKSSHAQAAAEGAALSGELGIDAQLLAMSEAYMELRSQGRFEEARAMKLRAVALKNAAAQS
jgi:hypothetical protein